MDEFLIAAEILLFIGNFLSAITADTKRARIMHGIIAACMLFFSVVNLADYLLYT